MKLKPGDQVGILHSDHDDYFFDNPVGQVLSIRTDDDGFQYAIVQVEATVPTYRLYDLDTGKKLAKPPF